LMTKSTERPTVAPQPTMADYEPPQLEVLGTVEELTMGGPTAGPDISTFFASFMSDRRVKEHLTPVAAGLVTDELRALQPTGYMPPRLEVLGTVDGLTMGGGLIVLPDNTTFMGTMTPSDWRLKEHFAPVAPSAVLDRLSG
jgi:hypothetical protein